MSEKSLIRFNVRGARIRSIRVQMEYFVTCASQSTRGRERSIKLIRFCSDLVHAWSETFSKSQRKKLLAKPAVNLNKELKAISLR